MTLIASIITGISCLLLGYHRGQRKGKADGYGMGHAEGYLEGHVAGQTQASRSSGGGGEPIEPA
jgi:hypothetical protein